MLVSGPIIHFFSGWALVCPGQPQIGGEIKGATNYFTESVLIYEY